VQGLHRTLDKLLLHLHEMVGGSSEMLDSGWIMRRVRVQFGATIRFVSGDIKHKLADLLLEVELPSRRLLPRIQARRAGTTPEWPGAGLSGKSRASELPADGGECFSSRWQLPKPGDNDTHLWFKRAQKLRVCFSEAESYHRGTVDAALGS